MSPQDRVQESFDKQWGEYRAALESGLVEAQEAAAAAVLERNEAVAAAEARNAYSAEAAAEAVEMEMESAVKMAQVGHVDVGCCLLVAWLDLTRWQKMADILYLEVLPGAGDAWQGNLWRQLSCHVMLRKAVGKILEANRMLTGMGHVMMNCHVLMVGGFFAGFSVAAGSGGGSSWSHQQSSCQAARTGLRKRGSSWLMLETISLQGQQGRGGGGDSQLKDIRISETETWLQQAKELRGKGEV